jgi:hypothetical protein
MEYCGLRLRADPDNEPTDSEPRWKSWLRSIISYFKLLRKKKLVNGACRRSKGKTVYEISFTKLALGLLKRS